MIKAFNIVECCSALQNNFFIPILGFCLVWSISAFDFGENSSMNRETGIQSVSRAMSILLLFTHDTPRLGITEISKALGLPKPTVHALARTLVKWGMLEQEPNTKKYRLGIKVYELGIALTGSLEINQKGAGLAYQLSNQTGLVSRIAIWGLDSALITVNIEPRTHIFFIHQIGPRVTAYCSALGKVLLAFLDSKDLNSYLERVSFKAFTVNTITEKKQLLEELDEIRRRGYSTDREENLLGMACIGAPIFGWGGRLEGAVSVSGDPKDIYGKFETLLHQLLKTGKEISQVMGYFPETLGMPS
ncbi:IclR helix-turn-helix domain protein [delta proteobacterium NaphS2]|nr:IclR helix-turn-helix domain protein [delta proteobacterium NaphS2]